MSKTYFPNETKEQRKSRKAVEKNQRQLIEKQQALKVNETFPSNSKIAFVLGNGTSRSSIDHFVLKNYGKVYACNAIYREFTPDHLIAVDTKMIKEISETGFHLTNPVWTNPNRYTREIKGLNLCNPNLGWSSGPTALNLASEHGHDTIYILGFDFVGIGRKQELVNNVYAGTKNYKDINDRATFYGNWQRQTSIIIRKNIKKRYIRVVEDYYSYVPDMLEGLDNIEHISVDKFKEIFSG